MRNIKFSHLSTLVIPAAALLGCSGTANSSGPGEGGSVSVGGSSNNPTGGTNAVSNAGGAATGGIAASGGVATGGALTTGGAMATGGRNATGGRPATGGATFAVTGGLATSGSSSLPGTGGNPATGGSKSGGGNSATGGAPPATGGSRATGGNKATGGTVTAGGSAATGGTPGGGGFTSSCGAGTSTSSDIVVNLSSTQQRITGFGVSSAWAGSYRNASDADYLWSTTKGAGLSLLRVRYGDGTAIAKSAASMGVTVWMTPWGMGNNGSPGGPYTTSQNNPNGCTSGAMPVLSDPQGWANQLSTYVQNLKTQGVPLYAVSAENEPDSCGINQTTSYSAAQMATWIPYLSAAMKPLNIKVMAPETMNRCGFDTYYTAIKNSTAAWDAVDIFASHEYGCGTLTTQPAIAAAGKEYWETEVDTGKASSDSTGDGIASALPMATTMHNDLTKPNVNAWHIWWVYNASGNGGCLYDTTTNVWTKRLWVLGNYSRYVRPGYMRVATTGTQPSGVYISAYTSPADGTVSIVAINTGSSAANVSLFITGAAPCSMTPYLTSANDNLTAQTAIPVSGSRFTASLASQSVTTFVGKP